MTDSFQRHDTILDRDRSLVLLVDVQERLRPVMSDADSVIDECARVLRAARRLDVPILVTEQYPRGLGRTVPELLEALETNPVIDKMTFSCWGSQDVRERVEELGRDQVVAIGVESHVCVMQTTLDLIAAGKQVQVPFDAVTSRSRKVREQAIRRMRTEGAVITCVESVLFEWLVEAGTDDFKAVSKMVKREITE